MRQKVIFCISGVFLARLLCSPNLLAQDAGDFKVGVIVSLSGASQEYGAAIQNCIELAKKDKPENFTHLKFIYEDAAYDTTQSVTTFNKLVRVDKVNLIYVWGVTFCQAVAPLGERLQIPIIAQCVDREAAHGRKYVIRFMNHAAQYQHAMLNYLRSKGYKRLGIAVSDNGYLEGMLNALEQNLTAGESVEIVERSAAAAMDFRTTIAKAKQKSFDALGVFLFGGQIAQFYRQASEQNLNTPTFGTNLFETKSIIEASGRKINGAVYANNAIHPDFLKRYLSAFGDQSQLAFGALAYEFAALSGDLFNQRGGEIDADQILEKFVQVHERPGVAAGPYSFKDDPSIGRYFEFPIAVKEIQGEDIKVIMQ